MGCNLKIEETIQEIIKKRGGHSLINNPTEHWSVIRDSEEMNKDPINGTILTVFSGNVEASKPSRISKLIVVVDRISPPCSSVNKRITTPAIIQ